MTVVPGCSAYGTPRRPSVSAYRSARFSVIALSVIVMFRKPGPETSMSLITSPDSTRATTWVASSRGVGFAFFARPRMPLAWKSALSLRRSSGSAGASGRAAERAVARRWWTEAVRDVTGAIGVGAVLLVGTGGWGQYPTGGKAVF